MDSIKLKNEKKLKDPPDPDEVNTAAGVLKYFDSAFSSIKIFPSNNLSVKKSIDSFYERITEFLDEYEKLIVIIEEFSFSYKGETVFQEEKNQNSLPFFLFKDGMRELTFYDGLEKRELKDFLALLELNLIFSATATLSYYLMSSGKRK